MQSYLISDTLVNPILTVLWTWSWSYSPWLTKHKYLQDVFRIHIRGCQVRVGAISALKRSLNIDRLLDSESVHNKTYPMSACPRDSGRTIDETPPMLRIWPWSYEDLPN